MIFRFGYVAMSVELVNCSPSRTVSFKTYRTLREKDPEAAVSKLKRTARENLFNTRRLLLYNRANNVMLYRFSSKMVPLATHPDLESWDYIGDLADLLADVGALVREEGMRVSFHPDHYTLINSPRQEVFEASMRDYMHHCRLLEAMGLGAGAKLVTHVGGGYRDKEKSLQQFIVNWNKLPHTVAQRITLENDDKIYTARDTLHLSETLGIPMVFDLHHFLCNREEDSRIEDVLPRFLDTWKGTGLNPKIHVSSPRSETDFRSHHDYVDPDCVYGFIKLAGELGQDIDIMVEAKKKDAAMFRLVGDLAGFPGIRRLNRSVLEYAANE